MRNKQNLWPLYIIATILFGIKTYALYRFEFDLSVDNIMQEIILFINPFATAFFIFAISVWFKPKRQVKWIRWTIFLGTTILYLNLLYFRSFTDFITLPVLFQSSNAGDLGSSVLNLTKIYDLLFFIDVLIVFFLSYKGTSLTFNYTRKQRKKAVVIAVSLLFTNVLLAEIERPLLFLRGFDREYLVKNVGVFNYHLYDIVLHSKTKAQRVLADGSDMPNIQSYVKDNLERTEKSELYGIAKDKNIIYISAESIQSFVINNTLNGKEITPFLNDLIQDSYYFENFYHQTAQGKTSDSEFLIENSLYPLPSGAVFFTHAQNELNAVPEIIKDKGYYSAVFHANNGSFWNRDVMYDAIGYDKFFDVKYYQENEENSIGWGLKDKPFFEQSIKYLKSLPEPYYAKFITLTNHHPFELEPEEASIDQFDSNSQTLNQYFQTVRYMDESIEDFFTRLKEAGLYKDSIIVIYGDHYGISKYHNVAMEKYLEKEIRPYENVQLQRVPLIVHIPGHEDDRIISKISGQIDMKPTILNMLGIKNQNDIIFGTDLFVKDRKPFVVLRDGSFITEDYIYSDGHCYNRETGIELQAEEPACESYIEQTTKELDYSDKIIYGDLFRFLSLN